MRSGPEADACASAGAALAAEKTVVSTNNAKLDLMSVAITAFRSKQALI
jgi:hypothetical protein